MALVSVTGLGKGGVQLFQPSMFISCTIIMPYRILHVQVSIQILGFETHTGMERSVVTLGFSYRASFKYYDKGYQQMPLSFVIFLYYMSLPYMFRASISPSSGVSPAVAYLLPLGSYSAWPFFRVRLGLWAISMW